jgi:CheY-like chemotaxis protein
VSGGAAATYYHILPPARYLNIGAAPGAVATGSPQSSDFSNVQARSKAHFWRAFLARIFGRIHNTRCVILDMRVPGMNGLKLRRRAAASHREAPVIYIMAHGDEGDTHR